MTAVLPNHQLKLDRALYHLQSLERETTIWLENKPYRLIHDVDIQSGDKLLVVEPLEPVPPKLALIAGDCLHNLRSALDNLVYELAVAYKGEPLSKSIERDIAFPILRVDGQESAKKLKRMIRGVHPGAQAIIKELQPYTRGSELPRYLLWNLNELSNKDKHRFPHLGVFNPRTFSLYMPPYAPGNPGFLNVKPNWGPVEGRTEVGRYFTDPPGAYAEVDMQTSPTFYVAFGKGSPDAIYGMGVENVLSEIHKWVVRKVVRPLAPYLN